jgi:hypothetical protein
MQEEGTMADEANPTDVVLSYTVGAQGVTAQTQGVCDRLQKLLADGSYRVVEIITDTPPHGSGSNATGFVCVTVLLSRESALAARSGTYRGSR